MFVRSFYMVGTHNTVYQVIDNSGEKYRVVYTCGSQREALNFIKEKFGIID